MWQKRIVVKLSEIEQAKEDREKRRREKMRAQKKVRVHELMVGWRREF